MSKLFVKTLMAALSFVAFSTFASVENFNAKLDKIDSLLSRSLSEAKVEIDLLDSLQEKMSDTQKGQFLVRKSIFSIYSAEFEKASHSLTEAESLLSSIEDLSLVYRFQMTNFLSVDDYKGALKAAKKQIKVIDHLIDPKNQRDAYVRMANFYFNLGANHSSQRYVKKAFGLIDNVNTKEHCFLKVMFAANAVKIKSNGDLKKLALDAIELCKVVKSEFGASLGYRVLAQNLLDTGELNDAEDAALNSLKSSSQIHFPSVVINNEYLLAKIYHKKLQLNKAEDIANTIIAKQDDSQINTAKEESYRILADIYSQEGDYKQAFEASKQAQKYQQLIYDDEKIKTLAYEAAKFDVEELEDFIQKNENTAYISSGREQSQIDKEMDLIYNNTILQYLLLLLGTTVFTSTYIGVNSYRRNCYNKLTGLLRHDAAMRKSRDFFHDAMYRKNGFAVISLDVDQLKDINRILGHERADWVLTVIADAIKKFTRFKKAYGCYSGGGSFYVYMELKQDQDAVEMAQQLIEQFDSCNTAESLKLFKMTASIGIASTKERLQGVNEKEICRRADVALHVAKEYAGNEIVHYQESFDAANDEYKKQMRFVQFIDPKLMVRAHTL